MTAERTYVPPPPQYGRIVYTKWGRVHKGKRRRFDRRPQRFHDLDDLPFEIEIKTDGLYTTILSRYPINPVPARWLHAYRSKRGMV